MALLSLNAILNYALFIDVQYPEKQETYVKIFVIIFQLNIKSR